jgi:uroporphyrinogen decarboxylase
MGNVSVDKLCRGTKEEIVKDTKECIRVAAPGGGYFLNSSNTWYADAKLENCMAMVEIGRKYGKYPIRF